MCGLKWEKVSWNQKKSYVWKKHVFEKSSSLVYLELTKVHMFWEGHKILRNLHLRLDCVYLLWSNLRWRFFVAFSEYMNFAYKCTKLGIIVDCFKGPKCLVFFCHLNFLPFWHDVNYKMHVVCFKSKHWLSKVKAILVRQ